MSTLLDAIQSRSVWHSGLQDITWDLLLMPQRKASKVTYDHATTTPNMVAYQACCPHLKNKNTTSYNLKRKTGGSLATWSWSGGKDSGQLVQQRQPAAGLQAGGEQQVGTELKEIEERNRGGDQAES